MSPEIPGISMAPMNEVGAIFVTAAIATVIAIWGVISQRQIARRQNTMAHITNSESDKDLIKARQQFITLAKASGGLAPWADADKEQTDEAQAIRLILNDFELISISIQFGVMDNALIRRFERGSIIRYWFYAAPYVYALRGRLGSDSLYHEFEEMARWMKTKNMPRRSYLSRLIF
jgi:hypothetical protein